MMDAVGRTFMASGQNRKGAYKPHTYLRCQEGFNAIALNVLLSGLAFSKGPPGRIVAAWEATTLGLLMSEFQLQEITRALAYPKIRKLLRWDEAKRETFIRQLGLRVELIDLTGVMPITVPADSDDNPILTTLVAGRADWLVTGDRGLLALRDRFPIETPAEFVRRLESGSSDRAI